MSKKKSPAPVKLPPKGKAVKTHYVWTVTFLERPPKRKSARKGKRK